MRNILPLQFPFVIPGLLALRGLADCAAINISLICSVINVVFMPEESKIDFVEYSSMLVPATGLSGNAVNRSGLL
jgi:hypothetical protein